jgi:hypothetical protein
MLGGGDVDAHAADRVDRNRDLLITALGLGPAAGTGSRLGMAVAGAIMPVVMIASLMMAGRRAVLLFVLRHPFDSASLE